MITGLCCIMVLFLKIGIGNNSKNNKNINNVACSDNKLSALELVDAS